MRTLEDWRARYPLTSADIGATLLSQTALLTKIDAEFLAVDSKLRDSEGWLNRHDEETCLAYHEHVSAEYKLFYDIRVEARARGLLSAGKVPR